MPLITTAKPDSPESGFLFSQFNRFDATSFPVSPPPSSRNPTMPTLAPPPVPRTRIAPGPEIDPPPVYFFGRSLAEYAQCFALDVSTLRGRDVLDVAAGPSSFTAEACARKVNAVAVDPLYGCGLSALTTQVQLDYDRVFARIRARPRL